MRLGNEGIAFLPEGCTLPSGPGRRYFARMLLITQMMRLPNFKQVVCSLARSVRPLQISRDETINVRCSLLPTPRQPLSASVKLSRAHLGPHANDFEDNK